MLAPERFLCVLFATVVKPISDFRLLISGLCAMLLALCSSAEAQQPAEKIPRIGIITGSRSESGLLPRHSGKRYKIWVILREKIFCLSNDTLREIGIAFEGIVAELMGLENRYSLLYAGLS